MGIILPTAPPWKHNQGRVGWQGITEDNQEEVGKKEQKGEGGNTGTLTRQQAQPNSTGSSELLSRLASKTCTLRLQSFSLWLKGSDWLSRPHSNPFKGKLYFFKNSKLPSIIPLFLKSRKGGRRRRRKERREGGREGDRDRETGRPSQRLHSEMTWVLPLYFSSLCTTHFPPKR